MAVRSWVKILAFVCFAFAGLSAGEAAASNTLAEWNLEADTLESKFTEQAEVWIDESESLSAEEIFHAAPIAPRGLGLGVQKHSVWVRMRVTPSMDLAGWFLRIQPTVLNEFDFHQFSEDGKRIDFSQYRMGRGGEGGSLSMPVPAFRLNWPKGESRIFVLRLKVKFPLTVGLELISPKLRSRGPVVYNFLNGIYFGALSVFLLACAVAFLILRYPLLRAYFAFAVALGLMNATLGGYVDYVLRAPFIVSDFVTEIALIATYFALGLMRGFLNTSSLRPRLDRVYRGTQWFLLLLVIGGVLTHEYLFPSSLQILSDLTMVTFAGVALFHAALSQRSSAVGGLPWLLGMLSVALGAAGFIGTIYGFIPDHWLGRSALQISAAFEFVFLSLAVALKIKDLERKKVEGLQKNWESNQLRNLIQLTTHDLANPMNVILTHAELAKKGQPGNWDSVYHAARQQMAILDFVRSHGAKLNTSLELELKPVSVAQLCETLGFLFEAPAKRKQIKIHWPTQERVRNLCVQADPLILAHSILGNFVSNALKFSKAGKEVSIQVEDQGDWVEFAVIDQGIGIAKSQRAERSGAKGFLKILGTRGESGSGIGLSLAQDFVKQLGGEFSIQSAEAGDGSVRAGTTVKVRLKKAFMPGLAPQQSTPRLESRPRRVLLIENEHDLAVTLQKFLQILGFEVLIAHDRKSAMGALDHAPFDVVVSDFQLDGVTGMDLIVELKREISGKNLPVPPSILMTGESSGHEILQDGQEWKKHFQRYLLKPFSLQEFEGTIRSVFTQE